MVQEKKPIARIECGVVEWWSGGGGVVEWWREITWTYSIHSI
jgi:hypothetical protein